MLEPGLQDELQAHGLLEAQDGEARASPRLRAAVARAALRLQAEQASWRDLRLPIAVALVELLPHALDEELASWVEQLVPIIERDLVPGAAGGPLEPSAADPG